MQLERTKEGEATVGEWETQIADINWYGKFLAGTQILHKK